MTNLHPVFEQVLRTFAPLAMPKTPSATPKAPEQPDLTGLYVHEHITDQFLSLRCYLEHEEAVDGGNDHPSTPAKVWLIYAFAGLVDVFELVEQVPGLQAKIEAEALESMKMDQWNVEYDRGEDIHHERMEA